MHQHVELVQRSFHVSSEPGELHPIGDAELGDELVQPIGVRIIAEHRTADHDCAVVTVRSRLGECGQEYVLTLPRGQSADHTHPQSDGRVGACAI